jgi:KDO2-lipid IV(A) lauroyltransferase
VKTLLHSLVYMLIRLMFLGLSLLPYLVSRALCRICAVFIWKIDSKHRRIGMVNLSFAFPGVPLSWHADVLRRSFYQLGDLAVEVARLPRIRREEVMSRVTYEVDRGLENYLVAKQDGRGLLFVTAHIGAWELLPAAHAARGYPLSFLVREFDNPFLNNWSRKIRHKFGNDTLNKRDSVRQVLRILKKGGDVGFLLDQNVQDREAVYVSFFGREAATSPSVAALAIQSGAPIVTGFMLPTNRAGHYKIRFYPPLHAKPGIDKDKEIARLTLAINERIEEVICEFPHCWLWGHRRFRTQSDGTNPYNNS